MVDELTPEEQARVDNAVSRAQEATSTASTPPEPGNTARIVKRVRDGDNKKIWAIAVVLLVLTAFLGQYNSVKTSSDQRSELNRFRAESDCRARLAAEFDVSTGRTIATLSAYASAQGEIILDLAQQEPTEQSVAALAVRTIELTRSSTELHIALERRLRSVEICADGDETNGE